MKKIDRKRRKGMGGSQTKGGTSNSISIHLAAPVVHRRDPYEVLNVPRHASEQDIKAAFRKFALKYHPDKTVGNLEATELFKEIAYSYSILSDPEKRRQYDNAGFEAIDADNTALVIDLSNFGLVKTMFAALFSKLGVPIKTTISVNVLQDALSGVITDKIKALSLGSLIHEKVEKQSAHFFSVTITEEEAQAGIIVRVTSAAQSKFKLLYFEQDNVGAYNLAVQEDSEKTGKVTSAGMYFLHFQVHRMDSSVYALAMAKDPKAGFFKRLEGFQPCEVSGIKAGTHVFAVYGDNFFRTASYTIEAVCAATYKNSTYNLKNVEQQILIKRTELREFEPEYKKALAQFQEVTNTHSPETQNALAQFQKVTKRYNQEKQNVEELLKKRDNIQSSFAVNMPVMKKRSQHPLQFIC